MKVKEIETEIKRERRKERKPFASQQAAQTDMHSICVHVLYADSVCGWEI